MKRINPLLIALIAVTLLAHITMSGGRFTSSLFALKNGYSESVAGLAYSFYALLPAFLSLSIGRWVDRVGPRFVMRVSLACMIGGLVLSSIWTSIYAVLVTAALSGLGFNAFILAANVAVGQLAFENESDRIGMFAWLQMGTSISSVVGPAVAGFVIDHFGFRATFVTLALCVTGGLFAAFRIPLPRGVTGSVRPAGAHAGIVRVVWNDPELRRIYGVAMTLSLAWDGFVFMAPVLGHARGYSATTIGMVLSAFAIGTFAVRVILPWLSRLLAEWRMLSFTLALTATVFLLLPFATSPILHAVLGFTYGIAAGAGQPNILNLVYRTMPPGREGEGVGLRSMIGNIVGLSGPSVFGAITGLFGVVPVFLLVGCVMSASSWQARLGWLKARTGPTS